jgi:hypothetical protein
MSVLATPAEAKIGMDLQTPAERTKLLRQLLSRARSRARRTKRSFDLSEEFVEELYQGQKGRCAVTGVHFHLEPFADAFVKHPYAPSIDRQLSSGGYTRDNIRLVCAAVNFGMGQWGEEVFLALVRAAFDYDKEKTYVVTTTVDDWEERQRGRIATAESVLDKLPVTERPRQQSRIRGLKAAPAKGPARMSEIARTAAASRRANRSQSKAG